MKTRYSILILICFNALIVFGQGVGIGTSTPDASAALDVTSVTKGVLVPRMTSTQRDAISNAATGLLVFDMTTNSFWFKNSSQWVELVDTSNTVVHKTGSDIYMGMAGRVGIGTTTPSTKLEVKTSLASPGITHTDGNVTLRTSTTSTSGVLSTITNHALQLNANNGSNHFTIVPSGNVGIGTAAPLQRLHVAGDTYLQGNVGIGMASPAFPLHFPETVGSKIALYGNSGPNFGFGVAANLMQLYTPSAAAAIGFGVGSSTSFSENMRLTGDGKLGIGTTTPTERLSVSGNSNITGGLTVGGALGVGLGIAVGGGIAVAGGGGVGGAMGVGTTTPAPSAQLDVSSTTKGLLMPRMTSAQRDAIQSPAEGLTVYNTETHSPWYRTNNEWKEIKEDQDSAIEQLVFRNGPEVIYTALNNEFLGVGVDTPSTKLQVKTPDNTWGISHTNGPILLSTFVSNAHGGEIGTSTNHPFQLFANGGTDQFVLTPQGNIGIGTAASHAPLQFANPDANRKIVLKESQNDNHHFTGIGSNSNSLRYQVPDVNARHLFYSGTTDIIDSSKLLMTIAGSGDVGIGVANPLNQLDIHQGTSARTGSHPVNLPLYVTGNIADAANGVEFRYFDGTQGIGFGKNTIYAAGSSANQNLGLSAKGTTGAIRLVTNGLERLYVTGAGNIGIGTISPNAPLQFANSVANRKVVLFETANNDHQYFGLGINGLALRYQVDGPGSSHVFYAGSSSSTSTELFRITGTGNVGIGVPSPLASLVVARGTGSNGTAEFKGTTNSSHFNYSTNEDTYIRGGKAGSNVLINDLAGEGNLGVGTSVPLQKLHVEGNSFIAGNEGVGIFNPQNKVDIQTGSARTGVHPTGLPLYVTGDISDESNGIEFRHSNGSQGVGIGFNTIYATGNNPDQDLGMASRGSGSLLFKTQQTERMRINENGNVGIGTSAPNAPLQFPNDIRNRKVVLYDSYNNDHQFYGFGINGYTLRYQVSSTSDSHIFYAGTSPTTSTELMRISGNGNVGIGTSAPSAKLDVAGDVNVAGAVNVGYYITTNSANVQPLTTTTLYCNCAAGYKVMGGGWNGPGLDVIQSSPDPTGIGWISTANNLDPILAHQLTAYAICARIGQ